MPIPATASRIGLITTSISLHFSITASPIEKVHMFGLLYVLVCLKHTKIHRQIPVAFGIFASRVAEVSHMTPKITKHRVIWTEIDTGIRNIRELH